MPDDELTSEFTQLYEQALVTHDYYRREIHQGPHRQRAWDRDQRAETVQKQLEQLFKLTRKVEEAAAKKKALEEAEAERELAEGIEYVKRSLGYQEKS